MVQVQVHTDEYAGPVITDHQYVYKKDGEHEGSPNVGPILHIFFDLVLVFKFFYPDEAGGDELQKV